MDNILIINEARWFYSTQQETERLAGLQHGWMGQKYRVELDYSKIYREKKKKKVSLQEEEDDWVITIKGTKNLDHSSFQINLCQNTITCDASLSLSLSLSPNYHHPSQWQAGGQPCFPLTQLSKPQDGQSKRRKQPPYIFTIEETATTLP